ELGDAALGDAPYVSQRGGVRGEGDPARTHGLSDRRRRAGRNGRGPRARAGVRGREKAVRRPPSRCYRSRLSLKNRITARQALSEIGRASCRERVEIAVGCGASKKN